MPGDPGGQRVGLISVQVPRSEQEQELRPPDSQLERILAEIGECLNGNPVVQVGRQPGKEKPGRESTCVGVSPPDASRVPSGTLGMSPVAALLISPHLEERRGQRLLRGRNRNPVLAGEQAARPEQGRTALSGDVFILHGVWFWWELANMESHGEALKSSVWRQLNQQKPALEPLYWQPSLSQVMPVS